MFKNINFSETQKAEQLYRTEGNAKDMSMKHMILDLKLDWKKCFAIKDSLGTTGDLNVDCTVRY